MNFCTQTIDIHCKREAKRGVVNNQILDWSFRLDGILHNASQDNVFQSVASEVVTGALDGYNGETIKVDIYELLNLVTEIAEGLFFNKVIF